jgi:hypothetical protein
LDGLKVRGMAEAATYKRARRALQALEKPLQMGKSWQKELRQLVDSDVRELSMGAFDDDNIDYLKSVKKLKDGSNSEGKRRTSWIWMSHGVVADAASDEHTHNSKSSFIDCVRNLLA